MTIKKIVLNKSIEYSVEYFELSEIEYLSASFISNWYATLKIKMDGIYGNLLPRICMVCGDTFGTFDFHHAIVTKSNIQGNKFTCGKHNYKKVRRLLIDTELNLIPLHNWCHISNPPTKDQSWKHQCDFYGEEIMSEWYYSLPFKVLPRRF